MVYSIFLTILVIKQVLGFMKKRIVLINPPYSIENSPSPPLGLIYLATYLKKKGYDVILDDYVVNNYSLDRVKKIVESFKPDFAGSTGATMNILSSLEILNNYKSINSKIVTIAGGPHVTYDAENILSKHEHVDFIVRGEGEITVAHLLDEIENNRNYKNVPGISYREKSEINHNIERPFIENINVLPLPDNNLIEISKYKALGLPFNMTTSRGCPFKCIFCIGNKMGGNKVRYYDVKRVVDEFEALTRIGPKQINIADDLFTSNKKRCIAICEEIINRGIIYPWTAFARVDTVTKELLDAMKKAGCTTVCFGIESGNQEILDRANKRITLDKCKSAVKLCKESGIEVLSSFILGLPGETAGTVNETLEFSKSLNTKYGYHILAPFPGTDVRDNSNFFGINILTDNWNLYDAKNTVSESIHFPHEDVENIVTGFTEGVNSYVNSVFRKNEKKEKLTPEEYNMIENVKSLSFVKDLIFDNLLEEFPGEESFEEALIFNSLKSFLSKKMGLAPEDVSCQIKRLIELNAIRVSSEEGFCNVGWI